jgi:hypothetical protein
MDDSDSQSNERRRNEAAKIIAENIKKKRMRDTDERLLDQDTLRRAAIRAGLEKPDGDGEWMPAAALLPRAGTLVEFMQRRDDSVRVGEYRDGEFREHLSDASSPLAEVSRWRYVG